MKKISPYLTTWFICLLSAIAVDTQSYAVEHEYPISKQIRYSFTLQNRNNTLLKKARFWAYAPLKRTGTQLCLQLKTSHPYTSFIDPFGNQVLCFTFHNLPPYATKIITINANLALSDKPIPMALEEQFIFLRNEKYIESDHPDMIQLAEKLKAPEQVDTAEKIFLWVSETVKYAGYIRNDRGALYALKNRRGDCTEYMYLFVALCRANKIPARGVGGYACSENSVLKPNDYHNWAEFYVDGAWRIADPQRKIFMQKPSHYVAMRVIMYPSGNPMEEFHRFRSTGDGLKVKMNRQ